MSLAANPPKFPAGPYQPPEDLTPDVRNRSQKDLAAVPANIANAVHGLSEQQLDTVYKNWSIRQIVHHVADSHLNCYIRFRWALTEDQPMIKAYDEGAWSLLPDAMQQQLEPSLALLTALHQRWDYLIGSLTDAQFKRAFVHPDTNEAMSLESAMSHYAWHGLHHTSQIIWLRENHHWS